MILDMYDKDERNFGLWVHFGSAIFLIAIAMLLNTKWIIQQLKQFKPYQRSTDIPTIEATHASEDNNLPPIVNRG